MINFILGTILGMYIMYKLSKSEMNFSIKYNWDDEEDK